MRKKFMLITFAILISSHCFALDISEVQKNEEVTLIGAMEDGITYQVRTSRGIEIWKDRDLYNFAGTEEKCIVLQSLGSEVLLYVPIMNAKYWFTIIKVNNR